MHRTRSTHRTLPNRHVNDICPARSRRLLVQAGQAGGRRAICEVPAGVERVLGAGCLPVVRLANAFWLTRGTSLADPLKTLLGNDELAATCRHHPEGLRNKTVVVRDGLFCCQGPPQLAPPSRSTHPSGRQHWRIDNQWLPNRLSN